MKIKDIKNLEYCMSETSHLDIEPKKMKKVLHDLKILKPLLLGHHPPCEQFNDHVIKIGKTPFCIGCFIGYPTAIIGIILMGVFDLGRFFDLNSSLFFGIVFLSSIILSPLKLTKNKKIKMAQKLIIGIGSSFLFWWIWMLPNPFFLNFLIFVAIFGIILTILNFIHLNGFNKICRKCNFNQNWRICPAFKEINDIFNIKKDNLKK